MRWIAALALVGFLTGCNWAHAPGAVVQLSIWAGTAAAAGLIALADEIEGDEETMETPEEQRDPANIEPPDAGK